MSFPRHGDNGRRLDGAAWLPAVDDHFSGLPSGRILV
jgi:hypothetical protein